MVSDQPTLNCFAWQEFIGLNWRAAAGQRGVPDPTAGPADFGNPQATAQTVWETYKAKTEVFLAGGVKPNPWNDPPPAPHCATSAPGVRELLAKPGVPVLSALSAFGDFVLDETQQASGQWLADNLEPMREMARHSDALDARECDRLFRAFGAGRLHWSRAWAMVVLGATLQQQLP